MKLAIYSGAAIGSLIGGYIPVLILHVNPLSGWSLVGGIFGTLVGLWGGYVLGNYFDL